VPVDRDSLVEAIALRDRLDARIAEATGAFEAKGWWGHDASASMTAWLRANARMTRRSAQRLRSLAVRLRALPVCAQAYAEGTLSGGQIEAIVALLDDQVIKIFAAPRPSSQTSGRAPPPAGPTPLSTSAGSSSTTSGPTPPAVTDRTSTWWSSSTT
jgi:hypothetical protein